MRPHGSNIVNDFGPSSGVDIDLAEAKRHHTGQMGMAADEDGVGVVFGAAGQGEHLAGEAVAEGPLFAGDLAGGLAPHLVQHLVGRLNHTRHRAHLARPLTLAGDPPPAKVGDPSPQPTQGQRTKQSSRPAPADRHLVRWGPSHYLEETGNAVG